MSFTFYYVLCMVGMTTCIWDFYDEDEKDSPMLLGLIWPLTLLILLYVFLGGNDHEDEDEEY